MADRIDITSCEQWRDIPGWEGLYQASSTGRIRSLPRTVSTGGGGKRTTVLRVMKQQNHKGYRKLCLHRTGEKPVMKWVHRLVCQSFHPRPNDDVVVAHNDGNPGNNAASNLRWATTLENALDKNDHGTMLSGEAIHNSILTKADVQEIRRRIADQANKIADYYGVSYATVMDVVRHKTWKRVR